VGIIFGGDSEPLFVKELGIWIQSFFFFNFWREQGEGGDADSDNAEIS
jgi:hypothetical protein